MRRQQLSEIWIYLCVVAATTKTVRTDTCPSSSAGVEEQIAFNPDKCVIVPNETKNSVLCYDPSNTTYSASDLRWFHEDVEVVFGTGRGDVFQLMEPLLGYNITRIYFSIAHNTPGCYTCKSITNSTIYRDLEAYEYVDTSLIPPSATTAAPMIPGALCLNPATLPETTTTKQTTVMTTTKQTGHGAKSTALTTIKQTAHTMNSTALMTMKQTEHSTSSSTPVATDQAIATVTTKNSPTTTSGSTTLKRPDCAIIGLVISFAIRLIGRE